jgi:hypothetical protein
MSEVAPLEDPRTATRWTVGADLGVGSWGGQSELRLGVDAGFRQDQAYGRLRVEGLYDDPQVQRPLCVDEGINPCSAVPFQGLARGSVVVGVPVVVDGKTALDVGLGPAWGVRNYEYVRANQVQARVRELHWGGGIELALRIPAGDRGFVRVAADVASFLARDLALAVPSGPEDPFVPDPFRFPGHTAAGLRIGWTR